MPTTKNSPAADSGPKVLLIEDNFFMFDSNRGILIYNWNSESIFHYYTTDNGGEDWVHRTTNTKDKDIRIIDHEEFMTTIFSIEGTVTTTILVPNFDEDTVVEAMVLHSKNFGKSFKIKK